MNFHRILKSNLPKNVQDDNIFFTENGEIYINNNEGSVVQIGEANGAIEWKPNASFTKNNLVAYDNKLYLVLNDFVSGEIFEYDTAKLFLISTRISGSAIQFWQPNTNYKIDDMIYYNDMMYRVIKGFQSGNTFETTNLSLTITDHNATYGVQGLGIDYFHLNSDAYKLVNNLSDNNGKLSYKGVLSGNMNTSIYDRNNDGVVDTAESLLGLTVSITELNSLQGAANNLQDQINAMSAGIVFKGELENKSKLSEIQDVFEGLSYIICNDEDHDGLRTYYVYNSGSWFYMGPFETSIRNFNTSPIDLSKETMGILREPNIDNLIARKSELHSHSNMNLISTYSFSNLDANNAIKIAHNHENLFTLNKLTEDGSGNLLYNGIPVSNQGGSGIVDLSNFTTDDLFDFPNKRYVTDLDKLNIAKIPGINSALTNTTSLVNTINGKIPQNITASNVLITKNDLDILKNNINLKDLNDVAIIKPNEMLTMDLNGDITSIPIPNPGISEIIDEDNNIESNVKKIKFKNMSISLNDDILNVGLKDMFSTGIMDMPKDNDFIENGFLVADINSKTYKQKNISEFTSILENKTINIDASSWEQSESEYTVTINHYMKTESVIVAAYVNNILTTVKTEILSIDSVKITHSQNVNMKIVINSSQGTISSVAREIGGSQPITPDLFIDDLKTRTDKSYSSVKIQETLNDYAKKSNMYSKIECDSKFSLKSNEHGHNNVAVLEKLISIDNELYYNGQKLLTSFNPTMHTIKGDNQNIENLTLLINTSNEIVKSGIRMINNAQFLVKNTLAVKQDIQESDNVTLIIEEGNIPIVNVKISPQESQQYTIGISPDVKIYIKGQFSYNYVLTGF